MTDDSPTIYYNDGGEVVPLFTLPPTFRADQASCFAFALPKSGSVLLHNLLSAACAKIGLTYVSIMEEFFKLGLADPMVPAETTKIFLRQGYCYGGFRNVPPQVDIPLIGECAAVVLVRDPRDMLVSHFFSSAYSHPDRGNKLKTSKPGVAMRDFAANSDIDAYVLRIARGYRTMFTRYRNLLSGQERVAVYRYEDVIYRKAEWLKDIRSHFGWKELTDQQTIDIASRYDVFPENEEVTSHIRSVHPGDYRSKLKRETVAELNGFLERELTEFGYLEGRENAGLKWRGWEERQT